VARNAPITITSTMARLKNALLEPLRMDLHRVRKGSA
jgi:hypothetical protein